jgi:hypothetical protein
MRAYVRCSSQLSRPMSDWVITRHSRSAQGRHRMGGVFHTVISKYAQSGTAVPSGMFGEYLIGSNNVGNCKRSLRKGDAHCEMRTPAHSGIHFVHLDEVVSNSTCSWLSRVLRIDFAPLARSTGHVKAKFDN